MTCCFAEKSSPPSLLKQNVEPLNEDSCGRAWQIILIVSLNRSLKSQEDQSKAEAYDMKLKAMESLKESKKRRTEEDEKQLPKKKRGSEALDYLREKMDGDKYLREKEFEIKVKEQERDEQRQKLAEDQHKDMMAMMNRQQQEMQQMQMRFFEQQQQQNNQLLALFQKALTK